MLTQGWLEKYYTVAMRVKYGGRELKGGKRTGERWMVGELMSSGDGGVLDVVAFPLSVNVTSCLPLLLIGGYGGEAVFLSSSFFIQSMEDSARKHKRGHVPSFGRLRST